MLAKAFSSIVLLLAVVGVAAVPSPAAGFANNGAAFSPEDEEYLLYELVNRERARQRLNKLTWDPDAARVARRYSQRMAREGFFDHYDPQGNSVMERALQSHVNRFRRIGENLFSCDPMEDYSDFAVSGWMRSATHRRNILDRGWNSTGIGVARARDGSVFVTQVFLQL